MRLGGETSMGAGPGGFPHTTGGLISQIHDRPTPDLNSALESLCVKYWRPIYRYIRYTWGKTNDDAKDLTQAFLTWLLQGDALKLYAPERGGFRHYLKLLLGRFVSHHAEAMRRLKRGGGVKILPLQDVVTPLENVIADPKSTDPEAVFDKAWLGEVVKNAVTRVKERYLTCGRDTQFLCYDEYELSFGDKRPTYADVAAKLNIKESDVRNYLFNVRAEVREELRKELMETTADDRELEEEWRELFGG